MLEIDAITVGYNATPVLRDVTIQVQPGQLVAVVGPNGAGKSTLFKTISGVLTPRSGSLRFEGVDIRDIPASKRPHLGIAHVPEGRQVFPSLTVLENLELGATTEAGRRDWTVNLEKILNWLP
ncbi:MAG: ATP-binding cassette domain-containing protein, partial [Betaproteobacteria bacterium]|nr:ATP-binding cassette domain-containing protein [Betaproteobacteria bacterium]